MNGFEPSTAGAKLGLGTGLRADSVTCKQNQSGKVGYTTLIRRVTGNRMGNEREVGVPYLMAWLKWRTLYCQVLWLVFHHQESGVCYFATPAYAVL